MRRRWEVGEGFWAVLGAIWIFGWIPIFLTIWALVAKDGLNGDSGCPAAMIFLACWFGPAILAGLGGLVGLGLWTLWTERPRRVSVPVTDDLRRAER